jgi:ADP-ribose pyrophosphatase
MIPSKTVINPAEIQGISDDLRQQLAQDTDWLHEKTLASETLYEGWVVKLQKDDVELANGRKGRREVIRHPGGVVVLPILDDGRILLVRQFRYPLGGPLLEAPAGKLEKGEEPLPAIQRELQEETGYLAKTWTPLGFINPAPGFCDETLWLFKAEGLVYEPLAEESDEELIQPIKLTPDEAMTLVQQGVINDAKTICILTRARYCS